MKRLAILLLIVLPGASMGQKRYINDLGVEVYRAPPRDVTVKTVQPKSLAQKMGLKKGDIILEINDRPIQSLDEYKKALKTDAAKVFWKSGSKYYESLVSWVVKGCPGKPEYILKVEEKTEVKSPKEK